MKILHKTTFNPVASRTHVGESEAEDTPAANASGGDAVSAVPIDQRTLLHAVGDVIGMLAAEERKERERDVSELREKTAALEGKVEALLSLMHGKGQIIDLPQLPKSYEASSEKTIRKVRVSR